MSNDEFILKLNGERLFRLIIRYNQLLFLGAPAPILSSELKMILSHLCKAVDATKCYPKQNDDTHKDFIDGDLIKKYSSFVDEYFQDGDLSLLKELRNSSFRQLGPNFAEALNEFFEKEKEWEEFDSLYEQGKIVDLEEHKLFKSIENKLKNWDFDE